MVIIRNGIILIYVNAAVNQKSVNGKPALYYRCHTNYRMALGFLLFPGGGVDTFIACLCDHCSFDEGDSRKRSGLNHTQCKLQLR